MGKTRNPIYVFFIALSLGVKSFGGPVRHIRIFRKKFVEQKSFIPREEFDGLVALSALLPGPSSSQIGIGIGQTLAGYPGAIAFWLGFTLPSAILMYLVAYIPNYHFLTHGLIAFLIKLLLILVVGKAWLSMGRKYVRSVINFLVFLIAAFYFANIFNSLYQIIFLISVGIIGFFLYRARYQTPIKPQKLVGLFEALLCLVLFSLIALFLAFHSKNHSWILANKFFETGALVFGGGHVVLPILQSRFVYTHLISQSKFSFGYAMAQFMPGPLFSFAAFVGASWIGIPNGLKGSAIALVFIFLPGALLMIAGMHFWNRWISNPRFQNAISAMNAAVVGILFIALIRLF